MKNGDDYSKDHCHKTIYMEKISENDTLCTALYASISIKSHQDMKDINAM